MKEYIIKVDDPSERAWDGSRKVFETKELVRCKDCKHYEYAIGCKKWHDVCTGGDDWFCADGERKDGNDN